MVIKSLKNTYTVIAEKSGGAEGVREFIVRDENGKRKYAASITGDIQREIYELLENIRRTGKFSDLKEYFLENGSLNIIFAMSGEPYAGEKLEKESLTAAERLMILKAALDKTLIEDAPPFFSSYALLPENVHVSAALKVEFDYDCGRIADFSEYDFNRVSASFCLLCEFLFKREFELKEFGELSGFCEDMRKRNISGYMELYEAFYPLYMKFCMAKDSDFRPDNFQARLQKKAAKILSKKREIIYTAALIAAAAYLFTSVRARLLPEERSPYFTEIGAVTFEEVQEE